MCQFKSAIVLRDEREKGGYKLLISPWTESHGEIETLFKLREGKSLKFAKVEFSPDDMAFAYQPERYKLKIDEDRTPDWFDDEMREKVTNERSDYIKSIIVSGDVDLLVGGQFIVAPGAKISSCHSMVINAICGGTISDIRGGTISDICGGTISDICGGTISAIRGGTISAIRGGTISDIRGGTISAIRGGTISDIRGGTISDIWGGTISDIRGGTISAIRGGTISDIWGGTISDIWGGTISAIWGGTISDIKNCFNDFGSIKAISKSANVTDNRPKK
jgi:hypothetical protein